MSTAFAHSRLRKIPRIVALAIAAAAISGCRSTGPELTATAVYERAITQLESLRTTATVVRARMKTTLEYAGTRVGQAVEARAFLQFSLENLGTDSAFIEANIQAIVDAPITETQPPPARPAPGDSTATTSLDAPAAVPIANATPRPAATADQRPRLENIVLATGVGRDDCALDANPRFTPESTEIYIVADAYNIARGATIASSWKRQGAEVARFSFQPENAINGNCIWFFIDQTDAAFTIGAWSVEIFVDGASVTSPLAFQIVSA